MKRIIMLLLIVCACLNCGPRIEKIEGELLFDSKNTKLFELSDSAFNAVEKVLRDQEAKPLEKEASEAFEVFVYFLDQGLLKKPMVNIKIQDGTEVPLFMEVADYSQIGDFDCRELEIEGKKIKLSAVVEVKKIGGKEFYILQKDLKAEQEDGLTLCTKQLSAIYPNTDSER